MLLLNAWAGCIIPTPAMSKPLNAKCLPVIDGRRKINSKCSFSSDSDTELEAQNLGFFTPTANQQSNHCAPAISNELHPMVSLAIYLEAAIVGD